MSSRDNERIIQGASKGKFNEKFIDLLEKAKFTKGSWEEALRNAVLTTAKNHDKDQAVRALKGYIKESDPIFFSRQNGSRERITELSNKGILTSEKCQKFFDYFSNIVNKDMKDTNINSGNQQSSHAKMDFLASLRCKLFDGNEASNKATNFNGICVVSDFHGERECLKRVFELIKLGKKVIILGDATDRGNDGIEILLNIKAMQTRPGNAVEYLPGNHDEFLYKALYKGMREYESTGNISNLREEALKMCEYYLNNLDYKGNGLTPTCQKLEKLLIDNPQEVYNLGRWLESQPLMRIEQDNKKRLALGHAAFDMDLYRKGYTLRDYFEDRINHNYFWYKKADICLWYRKNDHKSVEDAKWLLTLPNTAEATDIIVGHTPEAMQVKLYGKNGTREAVCVDYGTKSSMGVYDSREGMNFMNLRNKEKTDLEER